MNLNSSHKAMLVGKGIQYGIPVVAVGVGIVLLRKFLKRKRNADGTTTSIAPALTTAIRKENLTLSVADAGLFANILYGAMLDLGTDEQTIYNTIEKIKTKDDMLLVIKAFGMKEYLLGGRSSFMGQDYNLIGWLRAELSNKEIQKIKPKFDSWGIPI